MLAVTEAGRKPFYIKKQGVIDRSIDIQAFAGLRRKVKRRLRGVVELIVGEVVRVGHIHHRRLDSEFVVGQLAVQGMVILGRNRQSDMGGFLLVVNDSRFCAGP